MGNAPGTRHSEKLCPHRRINLPAKSFGKLLWLPPGGGGPVAGARAAPTKRNVSSIKINYKGRTVHTVQGGLGSSSKVKRGDRAISQRLAPSSGQLTPKEQYQHFPFSLTCALCCSSVTVLPRCHRSRLTSCNKLAANFVE